MACLIKNIPILNGIRLVCHFLMVVGGILSSHVYCLPGGGHRDQNATARCQSLPGETPSEVVMEPEVKFSSHTSKQANNYSQTWALLREAQLGGTVNSAKCLPQ